MQPLNAKIVEIDGKIGIHVIDLKYFETQLKKVGVGKECSVQIDKPVHPGTFRQNQFLHALLKAYYLTRLHPMPEGFFRPSFLGLKVFYKEMYRRAHKAPESWSKWNKAQRMGLINLILTDIHESGAYAESKDLQEIIEGAEKNNYYEVA